MIDWATILKDYPAVVTAIATVLVAILGFFFVRWNSIHNTNLELQKKNYDRRASIHDMRIKEARDYLDSLKGVINAIRHLHFIYIDEDSLLGENMQIYFKKHSELPLLLEKTAEKTTIIEILNDAELEKLQRELFLIMLPRLKTTFELSTKFLAQNTYDFEGINPDNLYIPPETEKLLTKMRIRLDELAKTI